jgi:hypothetical protein
MPRWNEEKLLAAVSSVAYALCWAIFVERVFSCALKYAADKRGSLIQQVDFDDRQLVQSLRLPWPSITIGAFNPSFKVGFI